MRKPRNIARYSLGLALAALTKVTILASVHVALAQAQVVTPSWTAATTLPTLHANGKIALTSDRDGNREIYVMNADGSNQIRITNNTLLDDHPTWSPDGTKIAFVCQKPSGGFALCIMNADGTNKVEVTPINNYLVWTPNSYSDFWSMSWSPDGNRIAFQENWDIYVVNADGSNRQQVTDSSGYDHEPSWSPDGSKILFASARVRLYPSLYTVKPDGTDLQAFPGFVGYWEIAPDWSPLGDKVLFVVDWTDDISDSDIAIANADGTNRQLFDGGETEFVYRNKPSWSPDGSKIIFDKWEYGSGDMEVYVKNTDGSGFTQLTNTSGWNFHPSWQPLLPTACPNPIDCNEFFVRQHYQDFLNREPDASGLAFWTNEITECGTDPGCIEVKRINVSGAFFISIEFQETGYLVYRFYKAAYGNPPGAPVPLRFSEFLPDTQKIGQGVIVNQAGWETVLENNKQAFSAEFVQRSSFTSVFPTSLTPDQFVDQLFMNAGVTPSATDRSAAINEFGAAMTTSDVAARARALRRVAENSAFAQQEFNRAFVLMQYFGYLRRNPNDPPEPTLDFQGYNFWLTKLNQFNGNFGNAEMVKAFLVSTEYRQRFGP